MISLIVAAALAQTAAQSAPQPAPEPCNAADAPAGLPGCPAWRLMVRDSEGIVQVDPATVRLSGTLLEVDMRAVYVSASENGTRSHIARARFDCARRTSAILHLILFDPEGRRLGAFPVTGEAAQPRHVDAGAPGHHIMAAWCPRRR